MTNQPLTLEFGEHSQRFFDGSFRRPRDSANPKIDDIKPVEPEISKIVMDAIDQFPTRKSMNPRLVLATAGAHLGDDHKAIRIRMERLLDNLIGYMRTVKVAGIDMVHARRNCLSQNSNCTVNITGWSPDLRTG